MSATTKDEQEWGQIIFPKQNIFWQNHHFDLRKYVFVLIKPLRSRQQVLMNETHLYTGLIRFKATSP